MNHPNHDRDKASWTVSTEKEEVILDSSNLLDMLFSRINKTDKKDFAYLLEEFFKFLNSSNRLSCMTPEQIATLSFSIGYYYKLFLQKNNVVISYSEEINKEQNEFTS